MAQSFTKMATFLCILLPIWAFSTTESASSHAAPAPAVDCSSLVLNMADCLSFVTNGSTIKKPEGTCCSGLKTVLKSNAECLCEAFKNSAQLGVTLNVSKAITLPSACHVSAPSVSNCGTLSPMASGSASSPSSVAGAPTGTPSIGSTEVTPAPAPALGSSGSSGISMTVGSLVLSLVAAASLSLF